MRLVKAMVEVERLLTGSAATIDEESALSGDAKYCLREYYRELSQRFEKGFDAARSLSPTPKEFMSPNGAFFIMRLDHKVIGCGAFKRMPKDAAYLKRMWIAADYRGLGLGKKLLKALEDRARSAGFRKALLETNRTLVEAQRLYKRSGYREVKAFNDEPYAHHWFEKSLP
jgi:ribosomal protein S18 acetylase RimI-like enzyme